MSMDFENMTEENHRNVIRAARRLLISLFNEAEDWRTMLKIRACLYAIISMVAIVMAITSKVWWVLIIVVIMIITLPIDLRESRRYGKMGDEAWAVALLLEEEQRAYQNSHPVTSDAAGENTEQVETHPETSTENVDDESLDD